VKKNYVDRFAVFPIFLFLGAKYFLEHVTPTGVLYLQGRWMKWRATSNVVAFIAHCFLSGMLSSRARLSDLTCPRFITFFASD